MDESKPSISPSEFRLQSASEWSSADSDPPPAKFAEADDLVARERQRHFEQIESCRNSCSDGPSGAARAEQFPGLAKPLVREATP
jgi:hypothetical protein